MGFLKGVVLKRAKKMLREPSTYKGLAVAIGVFGVSLAPEKLDAIAFACASLYAALAICLPDVFGDAPTREPVPETAPYRPPVVHSEPQRPQIIAGTLDSLESLPGGNVSQVPDPQKWDGKVPGQMF